MTVFTGNVHCPQRRRMMADYRVRGSYDLYDRRCSLFDCVLPYKKDGDFDKLRLDDYLV